MKMTMTDYSKTTNFVIYDRSNGLFLQAFSLGGAPLWCTEYPNAMLLTSWGAKRTLTKLLTTLSADRSIEVIENYGFESEKTIAKLNELSLKSKGII